MEQMSPKEHHRDCAQLVSSWIPVFYKLNEQAYILDKLALRCGT